MEAIQSLPRPADRPGAAILVFDGQCRVCTGSMERLEQWDRWKQFAFVSLHDPEARRLVPDLTHEDLMREIYLLDGRGGRWSGAAAFRLVARRIPWLWPLVPLLYVPGSLVFWNWLYRLVARGRYLLGRRETCHDGTCRLPGGSTSR